MLGISDASVRKLYRTGRLKCEKMPMSRIARVHMEDFVDFCRENGIDPRRIRREGAYTVKKVAEIAGVTEPFVRKWIASGRLPSFGKGIGYCKVFPSELEKFLNKRR